MSGIQEPLWHDGWDEEADTQAARDLHTPPVYPLAEHGRAASRGHIPHHRPIHDVIRSL